MGIPRSRLNSEDRTGNEIEKVADQAGNQYTVMHEASEQIALPRSSQNVCLKARLGREFTA
jgi:hypothetical protein